MVALILESRGGGVKRKILTPRGVAGRMGLDMASEPTGLQFRHFEQMARLEEQYYGAEFITPPEEAWRWYERYPYTVVVELVDDAVVGFVNLFPVKADIYEALCEGRFNDHFLTLEGVADIAAPGEAPLHMFLSCVLVEPAYREQGLTRRLLAKAAAQYAAVRHRCTAVVTDNVTEDGEQFSLRYGFRLLCHSDHGSAVYAMPWAEFERALTRGEGRG